MKQPYFASSESVEHYTPRYIWERAIRCMGADSCDGSTPMRHNNLERIEKWRIATAQQTQIGSLVS
jgi:hypothetical protein